MSFLLTLFMSFEQQVQQKMFSSAREKTFTDKILARKDVEKLRELIKKPILTRGEILEMMYLISGTEAKLLNYSDRDRYIILKFFVWIREFIKTLETLFDYEAELLEKQRACKQCNHTIKKKVPEDLRGKMVKDSVEFCDCANPKPIQQLTKRTLRLLKNNKMNLQHNTKFLVDLYLNIARTSMSVGGAGFMELLKNKYELQYTMPQNEQLQKGGFMGIGGKRG